MLANDQQNTVLCELSQDGRKERAYSAYGHRAVDEAVHGRLAYNGELRELQTGCYGLGNGYRVFNPVLMRFQAPDYLSPFGEGGLNTYSYTSGDPVNNSDPTGHMKLGVLLSMLMAGGDDALAAGTRAGRVGGRGLSRTAPALNSTSAVAASGDDILAARGFVQHSGSPATSNTGLSTLANAGRQDAFRTTSVPAGRSRVSSQPVGPSAVPQAIPSSAPKNVPGPSRSVETVKKAPPTPKAVKVPSKSEWKGMGPILRADYIKKYGDPFATGFHSGVVKKTMLDVRKGHDRFKEDAYK